MPNLPISLADQQNHEAERSRRWRCKRFWVTDEVRSMEGFSGDDHEEAALKVDFVRIFLVPEGNNENKTPLFHSQCQPPGKVNFAKKQTLI